MRERVFIVVCASFREINIQTWDDEARGVDGRTKIRQRVIKVSVELPGDGGPLRGITTGDVCLELKATE